MVSLSADFALAQSSPDAGAPQVGVAVAQPPAALALPETTPALTWPRRIPALDVLVQDPGDRRRWTVITRSRAGLLSVIATVEDGQLAVSFEQRAMQSCPAALGAEARSQRVTFSLRAEPATALRAAVFNPDLVFQMRAGGYELEYGCVEGGASAWIVSAMAQTRSTATLSDTHRMAARMAEALTSRPARTPYALRLDSSQIDLAHFDDEGPWLFAGEATGFPLPSDAVSARASEPSGATLTVGRRPGRCAEAWSALRPWLVSEGERTDRPGYVPALFGARIRRVHNGDRLREVYCAQPWPNASLIVSAVFQRDNADAMTRIGAMLEVIARAVQPAAPVGASARRANSAAR